MAEKIPASELEPYRFRPIGIRSPAYVPSGRLREAFDRIDAPLSRREVRIVLDHQGGWYRRSFPGILDRSPTLKTLICSPKAFAAAGYIVVRSIPDANRIRSRIRDVVAPLMTTKADGPFAEFVRMANENPGKAFREREVGELARILATGEPDDAVVAFLGLVLFAWRLDTVPDWPPEVMADEDVRFVLEFRQATQTLDEILEIGRERGSRPRTDEDRQAFAHDMRSALRQPRFDEIAAKVFPGLTFEQIVDQPDFYARIEVGAGEDVPETLLSFSEETKLLSSISSRGRRREIVAFLQEATGHSRSERVHATFASLLERLVEGRVRVGGIALALEFVGWYALRHPDRATSVSARIDGDARSEVARSLVAALAPPSGGRRRAEGAATVGGARNVPRGPDLFDVLVDGARTGDREPSRSDDATPVRTNHESDEDMNHEMDPEPMNDVVPATEVVVDDSIYSTEARLAQADWARLVPELREVVGKASDRLLENDEGRAFLVGVADVGKRLRDALHRFEAAMRPVVVDEVLQRLSSVATAVIEIAEAEPVEVPSTGVVRPHELDSVMARTSEGERALEDLRKEVRSAEDLYSSMGSVPLAKRRPLVEEYAARTESVLRLGGVARGAVVAALAYVLPRDASAGSTASEGAGLPQTSGEPSVPEISATPAVETVPVVEETSSDVRGEEPGPTPRIDDAVAVPVDAAVANALRRIFVERGMPAAIEAARARRPEECGEMARFVLEAVSMPGAIEAERYFESSVMETYELAALHLFEVPSERREEMTGLLALASLEGETLAPGGIFSQIIDQMDGGQVGVLVHGIRDALRDVVTTSGVPTPSDFKKLREKALSDDARQPAEASIHEQILSLRQANFSYSAADTHRDEICSPKGFFGKVEDAVRSGAVDPELVAWAESLSRPRDAGKYIDQVASDKGAERLYSSGRSKFVDAITSLASSYLKFAELGDRPAAPASGHRHLAEVAAGALGEIRRMAASETSLYPKACLLRGEEILIRYHGLVSGTAGRPR